MTIVSQFLAFVHGPFLAVHTLVRINTDFQTTHATNVPVTGEFCDPVTPFYKLIWISSIDVISRRMYARIWTPAISPWSNRRLLNGRAARKHSDFQPHQTGWGRVQLSSDLIERSNTTGRKVLLRNHRENSVVSIASKLLVNIILLSESIRLRIKPFSDTAGVVLTKDATGDKF